MSKCTEHTKRFQRAKGKTSDKANRTPSPCQNYDVFQTTLILTKKCCGHLAAKVSQQRYIRHGNYTVCMTFKAKSAKSAVTPFLTLGGQNVKSVNHYKYLGVMLDTAHRWRNLSQVHVKKTIENFCGLNWQLWHHKHWNMTSLTTSYEGQSYTILDKITPLWKHIGEPPEIQIGCYRGGSRSTASLRLIARFILTECNRSRFAQLKFLFALILTGTIIDLWRYSSYVTMNEKFSW